MLRRDSIRGVSRQRLAEIEQEKLNKTDGEPHRARQLLCDDDQGMRNFQPSFKYSIHGEKFLQSFELLLIFLPQGCIYQFSDELREQLIILGSVGFGICITKIFGIVLACSLYIKLKKLYEQSANQTPANLLARDRVSFIYGIDDDDDDERLPDPPSSANRNSFRPDFSESNVSNRPNSIYDRRV